ncbi:hypothetical protein C8R42DRAFT_690566 [Lentinula raphanica]|nr:hypothetical protein C8R42DRAFT_690566 [Lentinula raphanica]
MRLSERIYIKTNRQSLLSPEPGPSKRLLNAGSLTIVGSSKFRISLLLVKTAVFTSTGC